MKRRDDVFSWQKAKVDWPDPDITCPYRFILKDTTKPRQTSPHEFGVGDYILSYTYHLYGGHNVTCNVYVTISKRVSNGGSGGDARGVGGSRCRRSFPCRQGKYAYTLY